MYVRTRSRTMVEWIRIPSHGYADHPQDERSHHTFTRTYERFDLYLENYYYYYFPRLPARPAAPDKLIKSRIFIMRSLWNSRRWVRERREARTGLSTTTYTTVCAIHSPLICGLKRHDRQIRRIISKGWKRILWDFERRTFRCSTACVQPAGHIFREQLPLQPARERRWKRGRSDCPHSWWEVFRKATERRRRKNTSPRQLFIFVCGTS